MKGREDKSALMSSGLVEKLRNIPGAVKVDVFTPPPAEGPEEAKDLLRPFNTVIEYYKKGLVERGLVDERLLSLLFDREPLAISYSDDPDEDERAYRADEIYGDFDSVLGEMVNNAFLHGNNWNPLKKVEVVVAWTGNKFQVAVHDEGQGFGSSEHVGDRLGLGIIIPSFGSEGIKIEEDHIGTTVALVRDFDKVMGWVNELRKKSLH